MVSTVTSFRISRAGSNLVHIAVAFVTPIVVVARDEQGTLSTGPGQPESILEREHCSMIEIPTGCITADQTGEICGAGWRVGKRAQWGTSDQRPMSTTQCFRQTSVAMD